MVGVILIGLAAIMVYMTAIWLVSLSIKDAGIVDMFWGPGFVLAALVYGINSPDGFSARKILLVLLVAAWGLRLGWHIGRRNLGHAEDYRYRNWRETNGGAWWWKSFFKVFALQGFLMWLISLPLAVAQYAPEPASLSLWDVLGIVVWGIGLTFEAVGDWQLVQFKADPANQGKVLRTGLWRYTRHPNYFGDAAVWWGYFLIALSVPGGWLTLFSPVLMTVMLMRVSGVALLEQNLKQTKPEYADYIATTNAFFPGLPREAPRREA